MFGLSLWEIVVLAIVLLVVVGPRELPTLLRTVGRTVTKLRSMSAELRAQSGIDEIIREEGLRDDIEVVRSLTRGNVVDVLVREATTPTKPRASGSATPAAPSPDPSAAVLGRNGASTSSEVGSSAPSVATVAPKSAEHARAVETGPSNDADEGDAP